MHRHQVSVDLLFGGSNLPVRRSTTPLAARRPALLGVQGLGGAGATMAGYQRREPRSARPSCPEGRGLLAGIHRDLTIP